MKQIQLDEEIHRILDILEEPENSEPTEWYNGKNAALTYCELTRKLSMTPGTNPWKELKCLDQVIEKGLLHTLQEHSFNLIDLGTGNGDKAVKIIKTLNPERTEQFTRYGQFSIRYFPIDFSRHMSQYALLNIALTFHPIDDEEMEIFLKHSPSIKNFFDLYSFSQNSKYGNVFSPISISECFTLTEDQIADILSLNDEKLERNAKDMVCSLEALIKRAQDMKQNQHWRGLIEKYAPHSFPLQEYDSTMDFLIGELEKGHSYLNERQHDPRIQRRLHRIQSAVGERFFKHANELLDKFETYTNSCHTLEDLAALEEREAEIPSGESRMPIFLKGSINDQVRTGVPSLLYTTLKVMEKLFYVEEYAAENNPFYESDKCFNSSWAVMPTRGIEVDFRHTANMLKLVEYLTGYSKRRSVVALLGQTLGNYEKAEREHFVGELAQHLRPGDLFMLGVDLRPDATWNAEAIKQRISSMEREYRKGERFMRFAIGKQKATYQAKYNPAGNRMEFSFETDKETIPMGFSYKFDREEAETLLTSSGFKIIGAEPYVGTYKKSGKLLNSGPEYLVLLAQK